eukprot:3734486-Pyramimonas_sp.AAC.1
MRCEVAHTPDNVLTAGQKRDAVEPWSSPGGTVDRAKRVQHWRGEHRGQGVRHGRKYRSPS